MHVDVERISACALGELPETERHAVLEHCRRCPYCGDQLAAAMLLARAAGRSADAGRPGRRPRVRAWPAAAALVLAAGLVAFGSSGLLTRPEPRTPGKSAARQVAIVEEAAPMADMTRDEGVRREIVDAARWIAEVAAAPISAGSTEEVLPAIDLFERGDYVGAAARLATNPSLPGHGEIILGASLFYGGDLEGSEAIFGKIIAEVLMPDSGSGWDSRANTAAYFLARIYYDSGRTDDARRWTRVATEAIDNWSVPGEVLAREHVPSVFVAGGGTAAGRRAQSDEDIELLVVERARYLFPADLAGRGWPWETGVPVALDAFEEGDFLTAAAELALVSRPAKLGGRGFHEALLGISLYYAGEYEDAGSALEEFLGGAEMEERPPLWSFAKDAGAYYLARLYAHGGRFDDARRLAGVVSAGDSAWVPAAELLLKAL